MHKHVSQSIRFLVNSHFKSERMNKIGINLIRIVELAKHMHQKSECQTLGVEIKSTSWNITYHSHSEVKHSAAHLEIHITLYYIIFSKWS